MPAPSRLSVVHGGVRQSVIVHGLLPVLLVLTALVSPAPAWDNGKAGPEELLELRDPGLIARLWDILHPDSIPPPGDYQVLLPPYSEAGTSEAETVVDDAESGAFILRNGTMEGRLDRAAWEQAAAYSRARKVVTWQEDWEEPLSEEIPFLWQAFRIDGDKLLEWTTWPSGLELGWNGSIASVKSANPQFIEQLDFTWTQKLFRHFLLGAGLHRTEYGGGLVRRDRINRLVPDFSVVEVDTPAFWTDPWWWWSLSAGVPGAKYTLYLADRPLPAFFWMESRAAALVANREEGRVVTQWTKERLSRPGNLAQSLELRLAHARYRVHWDADAYATAVHAFELDEMPAFIGHWGIGILTSGGVAATHAWLDLADYSFSVSRPVRYPTDFRLAFLRLSMAYRGETNFQLGISLSVRIDNPLLSFPGGPQ